MSVKNSEGRFWVMVEKSFKRSQDNASYTIAVWRLVYAFISKKEQAKEEKTRQQNREMIVFPNSW
jgi:hypothetical protein